MSRTAKPTATPIRAPAFVTMAVVAAVAAAVIALSACSPPAPAPQDDGALRIAVARFQHETCTFCPRRRHRNRGLAAVQRAAVGRRPAEFRRLRRWLRQAGAGVRGRGAGAPDLAGRGLRRFVPKLEHQGDLRPLPRCNVGRTGDRASRRRGLPGAARGNGCTGRAPTRSRDRPALPRVGRPGGPHRGDIRPARQRGRRVPRTRGLRLRDQTLPALRRLHPGRARGTGAPARGAGRIRGNDGHTQARHHHGHRPAVDRPVTPRWTSWSGHGGGRRGKTTPT